MTIKFPYKPCTSTIENLSDIVKESLLLPYSSTVAAFLPTVVLITFLLAAFLVAAFLQQRCNFLFASRLPYIFLLADFLVAAFLLPSSVYFLLGMPSLLPFCYRLPCTFSWVCLPCCLFATVFLVLSPGYAFLAAFLLPSSVYFLLGMPSLLPFCYRLPCTFSWVCLPCCLFATVFLVLSPGYAFLAAFLLPSSLYFLLGMPSLLPFCYRLPCTFSWVCLPCCLFATIFLVLSPGYAFLAAFLLPSSLYFLLGMPSLLPFCYHLPCTFSWVCLPCCLFATIFCVLSPGYASLLPFC